LAAEKQFSVPLAVSAATFRYSDLECFGKLTAMSSTQQQESPTIAFKTTRSKQRALEAKRWASE